MVHSIEKGMRNVPIFGMYYASKRVLLAKNMHKYALVSAVVASPQLFEIGCGLVLYWTRYACKWVCTKTSVLVVTRVLLHLIVSGKPLEPLAS